MTIRRISEAKGFQLATAEAALQTLTAQDGLRRFLEWANESEPALAGYERSIAELQQKGLLHERA